MYSCGGSKIIHVYALPCMYSCGGEKVEYHFCVLERMLTEHTTLEVLLYMNSRLIVFFRTRSCQWHTAGEVGRRRRGGRTLVLQSTLVASIVLRLLVASIVVNAMIREMPT